jgi:hypothetical protein
VRIIGPNELVLSLGRAGYSYLDNLILSCTTYLIEIGGETEQMYKLSAYMHLLILW